MALAPTSSSRRILSSSRVSGPADATSGFFSLSPRYLVERSDMGSLLGGLRFRCGFGFGCAILPRSGFIQLPPSLYLGLCLLQQPLRCFRLAVFQHGIARLVIDVLVERQRGRLRIENKWILTALGQLGIVTEQDPVPGSHGILLLLESVNHVVAMRDAVAVRDDQRRPVIRLRFEKSLQRM